ncbi:FAD-binding protein [Streptomyces sp. SID3343]|nr:FAD-binding protein [Streptomyces sp. SID3343]
MERSPAQERGGATKGSWANLMVSPEGVVDPDVIQRVIDSHPDVDETYFRTLEAAAGESVRWLEKHGVSVAHAPSGFAMEATYGATVGGGHAIVEAPAQAVERYPAAEFHYETEAVRLCTDDAGRVNGVLVRGPDGLVRTLSSGSVVLACGGFEGNYEMRGALRDHRQPGRRTIRRRGQPCLGGRQDLRHPRLRPAQSDGPRPGRGRIDPRPGTGARTRPGETREHRLNVQHVRAGR